MSENLFSRRVMAIASQGGHWVQLLRLRPAWDGCQTIYVTTNPGYRESVIEDALSRNQPEPRFYAVRDANRWNRLALLQQLITVAWIILKTRPQVIITTGAAPGFIAICIGRAFGARTIWIDSIANAEELSLSGQRVGPYAHLWLTQWAHLARPEGPHHMGGVL
jgi:UDP-N-acetylglucosamine:LPS N-acetylglucosamine transferase